ncbi:TetR family transcriptional regulator [Mycolicibacterium canariasense]|uniref:TetR family transcriptional regulator n=1 Tax=Mycolicibacterium canariasense TaxID=228230 RepID=A0A100WFU9_MYCCR|nr:TetR family transcriptional regulator [Mycolicibacterium canariasense]MCV7210721.1 TetR family transcriptional regulator [Mycolicibacterium canariasense]ORU98317.1 TetR family transcriptional regulator [Mycolicibacterium canariasense]GAS97512.1 TetR family transcriptional regulator [Mycolicibacterium canariasense]
MSRWQPDARGRLEKAALELYAAQGFDATTVAEIADRAGLTERTFFRHFTDKREVLFSGQATLTASMVAAVAEAAPEASLIDVVSAAVRAAGAIIGARRDSARRRQAVIDANPGLRERELIKLATLATALTDALRARGLDDRAARLTAEVGVALFKVAFEQWIRADGDARFDDVLEDSIAELRVVTAAG